MYESVAQEHFDTVLWQVQGLLKQNEQETEPRPFKLAKRVYKLCMKPGEAEVEKYAFV